MGIETDEGTNGMNEKIFVGGAYITPPTFEETKLRTNIVKKVLQLSGSKLEDKEMGEKLFNIDGFEKFCDDIAQCGKGFIELINKILSSFKK